MPHANLTDGAVRDRHPLKSECIYGHPYIPENTYAYTYDDGHVLRQCRVCRRRRKREEKARRRARGRGR